MHAGFRHRGYGNQTSYAKKLRGKQLAFMKLFGDRHRGDIMSGKISPGDADVGNFSLQGKGWKVLRKTCVGSRSGGGSRIRTHEEVTPLTVFKTAAFNHSAIPPRSK
jgi:hypothetical protein